MVCRRAAVSSLAVAAIALVLAAPAARAATDPARTWVTLTTEHFAVHTYDDGVELADRVARYAEEAWAALNPALGWTPAERVQVLVLDDGDAANGFASVMPYARVTVLAFPPEAHSDLGDNDDWLRMLVFHEYAHVAHLDNARGVPEALNTLFGKVMKPNQAAPRWLSEGIATWVETRWSGGGRTGSSRFEMLLRAAALANRLPALSELTGAPLQLPRGTAWYLYGSYLWDWIVRHTDPDAVKRFATAYGERVIPYALNTVARQASGKTLGAWYEELLEDVRVRARATRARVVAEGRVEGRRLTSGGETKAHPALTADGRHVVYTEGDGHQPSFLARREVRPGAEPERIIKCEGGCGRFTFTADQRAVVMPTGRPWRQVNTYTDLRRVPLEPGLPRRAGRMLTSGARARAPALAADGRSVWVVRTRWGRSWLEQLELASGRSLGRWDPPAWARVDTPAAHPDGQRLFATLHHEGHRDVIEIDLAPVAAGGWRRLTSGSSTELDLGVTRDGGWLFYASDAHEGIFNIYARDVSGRGDRDGRTFRLTNVVTGAFQPTVSADGTTLLYVGWTVEGDELFALPFAPETAGVATPVPDPRPPRTAPGLPEVEVSGPEPYRPLPTMLPRSWMPFFLADSTGVGRVGLTLSGRDVTGRFGAVVSAEADLVRTDLTAYAAFDVALGYPDLRVSVGRYTWDRTSFFADRSHPYREEVFYGSVDASVRVPSVFVPMTLSASFTASVDRAFTAARVEHSPDSFEPSIPDEGFDTSMTLSWSFSDVEGSAWGISPVTGTKGGLTFRLREPTLGSRHSSWSLKYRLHGYVAMPAPLADHVISLGIRGGWAGGDPDHLDTFSLGGAPRQDLVSALINLTQGGATWLRGFASDAFSGTAFHHLTAEYRLPLWRVRQGLETLPLFARDLSLAVFSDVGFIGEAPLDVDAWRDVHAGVGAELRITTDLLFGASMRFRLGYARGIGRRGEDQVYLLLAPDP